MLKCAECPHHGCQVHDVSNAMICCPTKNSEIQQQASELYKDAENYTLAHNAAVANSVLCCLRTASPQGIGTQASQGSVAPLAERDSETFSIMFAVHPGLFPSAFDILPNTDPDRPC